MNGTEIVIPQEYHPEKVGGYVTTEEIDNIFYLNVVNLEESITTEFLSWLITYCLSKDLNLFWVVSGKNYAIGSKEFISAMVDKVKSEKVEE
jgi:hypothetical protein